MSSELGFTLNWNLLHLASVWFLGSNLKFSSQSFFFNFFSPKKFTKKYSFQKSINFNIKISFHPYPKRKLNLAFPPTTIWGLPVGDNKSPGMHWPLLSESRLIGACWSLVCIIALRSHPASDPPVARWPITIKKYGKETEKRQDRFGYKNIKIEKEKKIGLAIK